MLLFLFVVVVTVIVVPLALVGLGPTVQFVSLTMLCPLSGPTTVTCAQQMYDNAGNDGLLVQLVIQVKARSYSDGKAKMRATLFPPGSSVALTTTGKMNSTVKVPGGGKNFLTFATNPAEIKGLDERMRVFVPPTGTDDRTRLRNARICDISTTINCTAPLTDYDVDLRGSVSSTFGPFDHTTQFTFKLKWTGQVYTATAIKR